MFHLLSHIHFYLFSDIDSGNIWTICDLSTEGASKISFKQ